MTNVTTTSIKYTVIVYNSVTGERYMENQFETEHEAIDFKNSYPKSETITYTVSEI